MCSANSFIDYYASVLLSKSLQLNYVMQAVSPDTVRAEYEQPALYQCPPRKLYTSLKNPRDRITSGGKAILNFNFALRNCIVQYHCERLMS